MSAHGRAKDDTNVAIPAAVLAVPSSDRLNNNCCTIAAVTDDWQQLLSDPSTVPRFLDESSVTVTVGKIDSTTTGLTSVPWKLEIRPCASTDTVQQQQQQDASSCAPSNDNDRKPSAIDVNQKGSGTLFQQLQDGPFPAADYLSLRRLQNQSWAHHQLLTGIQHAQQQHYQKAAACYQQGLGLVPHHTGLLVASAALEANQGRREAALALLQQALALDPHHANAAAYQAEILAYQQKSYSSSGRGNRASKAERALQDASLEKAFEAGDNGASLPLPKGADAAIMGAALATDYPMLSSESDSNSNDRRRQRERKRKRSEYKHEKRRKHKRRKRRRRNRSDHKSDSNSSSGDDSVDSNRETYDSRTRRKKRKKRHKEHRKSRHDERDESSREGSSRQRKRRRKERKSTRSSRSIHDDSPNDSSGGTVDSLEMLRNKSTRDDGSSRRRKRQRKEEVPTIVLSNDRLPLDDNDDSPNDSSGGGTVDSLEVLREQRQLQHPATRPEQQSS